MLRPRTGFAVVAALCAVTGGTLTATTGPPAMAATPPAPTLDRTIFDAHVTESSGLARSTYKRKVVWTHNDKGDKARIFAIRKDGTTRAVLRLRHAENQDWEDIAAGPNHTLWIGDIGDNDSRRDSITVYRVVEPKKVESGRVNSTSFVFRYPDGAHNAEALMVRPKSGRLFVVTKSRDGGTIFRAPKKLSSTKVNKLTDVATAPALVTAGSFAPDSKQFVLGTYAEAFLYAHVGSTATPVHKPGTPQGESLEINRAGTAILVGSEGTDSPVYRSDLPSS